VPSPSTAADTTGRAAAGASGAGAGAGASAGNGQPAADAPEAAPPVAPPAAAAREPAPSPAGSARSATLRLEGEIWTVSGTGSVVRLKDRKGLQYLATLLEQPDVEVHAMDLVQGGAAAPAPAGAQAAAREATVVSDGGDAGVMLDDAAKRAYRERLQSLDEDLEEAERFHDVERAAQLRQEREFLGAELARAVGLGGRDRRASNASERARVNVTRAIRGAVKAIAEHDARLGHHLEACIRTGVFCAYRPAPDGPDGWRVNVER
jgi:hypothetical protein